MDCVYLIRLDEKLSGKVQYYIGYTPRHPLARLKTHRAGKGSRLLAAATERGIHYRIVRVWWGKGRKFERSLKNHKNAKKFCPIASPKRGMRRSKFYNS